METNKWFDLVKFEMEYALKKYGDYHNSHEHLGVLLEEFEEWKDEVKGNTANTPQAIYELIQIAAVALRYAMENGCVKTIAEVQEKRHES